MKIINENNTIEITNYLVSYSYVYIYGAGNEAKRILEKLKNIQIEVTAMVVSDKSSNPDFFMDIPVLLIDDIPVKKENVFILGVSELYSKEIEEKLVSLKHNNVLKLTFKTEVWKLNRLLPKLEITAKIGCKIQCKYCPQNVLYRSYFEGNPYRCKEMSMDDYRKCLGHIPKETVITFAGFVEPFLHPYGVEMIKYAYEEGHPVELYTTFVGLTKSQFDMIKHIPFREVVLHTPDKKQYATIPITEEYSKILDEALDLKKANGNPFVDSANCQSEPSEEFLKIARGRIGVESALIDRAGTLGDNDLKHSNYKYGSIVCNRSCKQNHWVLLPDGTVTLCCMDFGLKHQLGNLIDSEYHEIINGDAYRTLRLQMSNPFKGVDILCRKCTSSREI